MIQRVSPECGIVRASADFLSCPDSERPKGTAPSTVAKVHQRSLYDDENDYLPKMKVVAGTAPRFTELPARCPPNATPAEITFCHMDSVQAVEKLLSTYAQPIDVLDEIQIAFVLFLTGYSVESLAHWRKILGLLANSHSSVVKHSTLYRRYLTLLQHQLPELPEELMEPTAHNTVYKDVGTLIANCSLVSSLAKDANYLSVNLTVSMSWPFDGILDEDPDDLPVVVET